MRHVIRRIASLTAASAGALLALGACIAEPWEPPDDSGLAEVDSPLVGAPQPVEVEGAAQALSIEDALKKCLVGRCKQGQDDDTKMPPYNLGWGYSCDKARLDTYRACMDIWNDEAKCNMDATAVRIACQVAPCDYVHSQCLERRCKKTTNSYSCQKKIGNQWKFGYWDWVSGAWTFIEQAGDEVPVAVWEERCDRVKLRCEQGRDASPGDTVPPVDRNFCSAACYGHNCHHAADEVCECLEEALGDSANVKVAVFGSNQACPTPVGNLYHSVIAIDHPTDASKRCLVESQRRCGPGDDAVESACCYLKGDVDDYKKLFQRGCSIAKHGPFQTEMPVLPVTTYTCSEFLAKQGTCASETPDTIYGEPSNNAPSNNAPSNNAPSNNAPSNNAPSNNAPSNVVADDSEQLPPAPCIVACGDSGFEPSATETMSLCSLGYHCAVPASVSCSSATCQADGPTFYRGICQPDQAPATPVATPEPAAALVQ